MRRKVDPVQRAILYARFSPRSKAASCKSCVLQLQDLRSYARLHNYQVAGEYHDDALSGGEQWVDRPGMLAAETACKRGMLFLVTAFDRLFRDVQMGLAFCAAIEGKGASIVSITEEAASLNTPAARLMRSIFLSVAEYQREVIRAKTKLRMLEHQAAGRRMGRLPPYGMQQDPADPNRWTPHPAETSQHPTRLPTLRQRLQLPGSRQLPNPPRHPQPQSWPVAAFFYYAHSAQGR